MKILAEKGQAMNGENGARCSAVFRNGQTCQELLRFLGALLVLAHWSGCTTSNSADPRLNGTWQSNRDASVAELFRRDPRWTNAPPQRIERVRDLFGHMAVTYSNGIMTVRFREDVGTLHYSVVRRGDDFVVIRIKGGIQDGEEVRIRFVDGGGGYWVTTKAFPMDTGISEKFDRLDTNSELQKNSVVPRQR